MSKRPPYFTTFVDVEIDPLELEKAGWVYQGEAAASPERDDIADVVRRWHDEIHSGSWRFCDEHPCIEIRDLYLRLGHVLSMSSVLLP